MKNLVTVSLLRDLLGIAIIVTLASLSILTPTIAIVVGAVFLASLLFSCISVGITGSFLNRVSINGSEVRAVENNDGEAKISDAYKTYLVFNTLSKAIEEIQNSNYKPDSNQLATYQKAKEAWLALNDKDEITRELIASTDRLLLK